MKPYPLYQHTRPATSQPPDLTADLLQQIHRRFYAGHPDPKTFHADRNRLLYALTWPAQWLEARALKMSPGAYQRLITERLDDIAIHGQPGRYHAYFPAYLLKCLQDHFAHHGDALHEELKHIRNALQGVDALLKELRRTATSKIPADTTTADLARAHRILHARRLQTRPYRPKNGQLELF